MVCTATENRSGPEELFCPSKAFGRGVVYSGHGSKAASSSSWTLTYSRLRGPKSQRGCGGVEARGSERSRSQRSPQLWLRVSKQGRLSCPQSCDMRHDCHLPQHCDKFTSTTKNQALLKLQETLSMPTDAANPQAS